MHLCIQSQERRSPEKPCHVGLTTAPPTNTCSQASKLTLALPENPAQDQANDSFCNSNHGVSYGNGGSEVSRYASSPATSHTAPRRKRVLRYKGVRRNRRLFITTVTELSAMALAANIGCNSLNITGRKVSE